MTAAHRKSQVKLSRKRVLRQMKRLTKTVQEHALRHRDLLGREWEKIDWTRPPAELVLGRIGSVLLQHPVAIEQAHRSIIQEKADAEVEFGNSLMICEQEDGSSTIGSSPEIKSLTTAKN